MADKNFYYKKELKEKVLTSLEQLNPRNQKREVIYENCPNCSDVEESFFYIPSLKYGRCTECSHEVGFEYYNAVMGSQLEAFHELEKKIKDALESF